MPAEVSLEQRFCEQEIAIARLVEEAQVLRDENADLIAQLEAARNSAAVDGFERLEAILRAGPAAPATARAALTRWLSGHVPVQVLEDARLLASELITNSLRHPEISDADLLRLAVQLKEGALRVEVRDPGTTGVVAPREPDRERGGGFGLQLVDMIATRWGVNRTGGTHVWFEVDAMGRRTSEPAARAPGPAPGEPRRR
jgi:anti-sigma regulatory factor (Ser/Thr protein kinase)